MVKVGNKYNFNFSDGIPPILGVEFNDEGSAVNLGINTDSKQANFIRITGDKLN